MGCFFVSAEKPMDDDRGDAEADSVRLLFDENEPTTLRRYEFPGNVSIVVRSAVEEKPGHLQSGIILWPGASALGHYLCEFENKASWRSVVELGAGCGLSGLVAARILQQQQDNESSVLFTDRDWVSLKVIKDSVQENHFAPVTVRRKVLLWTEDEDTNEELEAKFPRLERCDLAIGSDLIYSTETAKALFCTVQRIMPDRNLVKWRFILSNSFREEETTQIIEKICTKLRLKRRVLKDSYHKCLIESYEPEL